VSELLQFNSNDRDGSVSLFLFSSSIREKTIFSDRLFIYRRLHRFCNFLVETQRQTQTKTNKNKTSQAFISYLCIIQNRERFL